MARASAISPPREPLAATRSSERGPVRGSVGEAVEPLEVVDGVPLQAAGPRERVERGALGLRPCSARRLGRLERPRLGGVDPLHARQSVVHRQLGEDDRVQPRVAGALRQRTLEVARDVVVALHVAVAQQQACPDHVPRPAAATPAVERAARSAVPARRRCSDTPRAPAGAGCARPGPRSSGARARPGRRPPAPRRALAAPAAASIVAASCSSGCSAASARWNARSSSSATRPASWACSSALALARPLPGGRSEQRVGRACVLPLRTRTPARPPGRARSRRRARSCDGRRSSLSATASSRLRTGPGRRPAPSSSSTMTGTGISSPLAGGPLPERAAEPSAKSRLPRVAATIRRSSCRRTFRPSCSTSSRPVAARPSGPTCSRSGPRRSRACSSPDGSPGRRASRKLTASPSRRRAANDSASAEAGRAIAGRRRRAAARRRQAPAAR